MFISRVTWGVYETCQTIEQSVSIQLSNQLNRICAFIFCEKNFTPANAPEFSWPYCPYYNPDAKSEGYPKVFTSFRKNVPYYVSPHSLMLQRAFLQLTLTIVFGRKQVPNKVFSFYPNRRCIVYRKIVPMLLISVLGLNLCRLLRLIQHQFSSNVTFDDSSLT